MFAKKVLIFNQVASGFSQKGRQLCGMVKLISNGKATSEVTVFVTNADIRQFGEWWVVLFVSDNIYAHNLETLNSCTFEIPETHLEHLAAMLVKRDNDCRLVAECSLGKVVDFKMRSSLKDLLKLADQHEGEIVPLNLAQSVKIEAERQADLAAIPKEVQADVEAVISSIENLENQTELQFATQTEIQEQNAAIIQTLETVQPVQEFETHFPKNQQAAPSDSHDEHSNLAIDVSRLDISNDDSLQEEADTTPYEKFVASTQNFYKDFDKIPNVELLRNSAKARLKSIEEYSSAFERFYAAGRGDNYYDSVKNEITRLFLQFPPHYPLTEKYKESYFVRVDFPYSGKYFVLGVVQREGKVKYICYGIPGTREGFLDKDFVYVEHSPDGFWMLFQDAETGQITAL